MEQKTPHPQIEFTPEDYLELFRAIMRINGWKLEEDAE